MKATIKVWREVEIHRIEVIAKVRYWEDAVVDGVDDTENGDNIPCKIEDNWCPIIEIDTGKILNWEQGKRSMVYYKVCDCCGWEIKTIDGEVVKSGDEYVPTFLCPSEDGYGDYIIMSINEDGIIQNWNKNEILEYLD